MAPAMAAAKKAPKKEAEREVLSVCGREVVVTNPRKVFFPEASATVIFVIMAIVLLVRPAGLFAWGRRAAVERV